MQLIYQNKGNIDTNGDWRNIGNSAKQHRYEGIVYVIQKVTEGNNENSAKGHKYENIVYVIQKEKVTERNNGNSANYQEHSFWNANNTDIKKFLSDTSGDWKE